MTAGEIFLRANRPDLVWTYGGDPVSRRLQQIVRQLGIPLLFALHNFAYRDRTLFAATDRVIVPTELRGGFTGRSRAGMRGAAAGRRSGAGEEQGAGGGEQGV